MSDNVRLSIILAVYNGYPYIKDSVESILNQTFDKFKLVVINDGSTDETRAYLESITDPRVVVFHQENLGLGAALNKGLSFCDTEYVGRIDADDVSTPNRFAEQIEYLDSHPEVGVVGCRIDYFYDDPAKSGWSPEIPLKHEDILAGLLRNDHALTHATLVFRRQALERIGGYAIGGIGEDWDLFLKLAETTRIVSLNKVLYKVRLHDASVTWKKWNHCQLKNRYAIYNHKQRQAGRPEISFDEFSQTEGVGRWYRLLLEMYNTIDGFSLLNYRLMIIESLKQNRLQSVARLCVACLVNPYRLVRRVVRMISSKK